MRLPSRHIYQCRYFLNRNKILWHFCVLCSADIYSVFSVPYTSIKIKASLDREVNRFVYMLFTLLHTHKHTKSRRPDRAEILYQTCHRSVTYERWSLTDTLLNHRLPKQAKLNRNATETYVIGENNFEALILLYLSWIQYASSIHLANTIANSCWHLCTAQNAILSDRSIMFTLPCRMSVCYSSPPKKSKNQRPLWGYDYFAW